ncbi:hypothetical protein [Conexibacter sp. CPCC 206217]|uniref:hypothetical protein n=1 Tax=Conexibacter sp. CPCC 206217 TaxID=3064574 RepID=UPI00271D0EB8|nr:hypothetical protein [Conexibacter sp. CPCC 206217]MDO8209944.1 hypothetical protein [Conexibacter sp. CPCC 206217]
MGERSLRFAATLLAAAAAVILGVLATGLIEHVNGAACGAEIPFCTTPTQQFARVTVAAVCGVGVVGSALSVWALWASSALRRHAYRFVLFAAIVALTLLIVDPAQHLAQDQGVGQWFGW